MSRIIENLMIVSIIVLAAYPIIKMKSMKRTILKIANNQERIMIGLLFGGLSMLGTLTSFDVFNNIKIHSSMIAPITGGLIGGILVGVIAGIIGALYRITIDNATIIPDMISLVTAGLAGGVYFIFFRRKQTSLLSVYLLALLMEIFNTFIIFNTLQPKILGKVYLTMIGVNHLIVNPLGVVLLFSIIKDI